MRNNSNGKGAPDCAAQILAAVGGVRRRLFGSTGRQVGSADPIEEHHGSAASSANHGVSSELFEEMKQQLLLKESLESALRQKVEYMELQLRQKDQENQYFKAQLDVMREEVKTAKEQGESTAELRRMEEALSLERANAVAQAKALAEAHVQLKHLQEQPRAEDSMVRAQQELMHLRSELRGMEEERTSARLGLANQALQVSTLSDRQMELQSALNAAHAEIQRQKEQLEAERQSTATPPNEKSLASKLSHSELQVLRTHMQSAVRRALEGAAEQGGEYQQKLQELDDKLVELSPTRLRGNLSGRSGTVVREVEQKLHLAISPRTPPEVDLRMKVAAANGSNHSAFGLEEPAPQAPLRLSPLRRPSNLSSSEVILPQGVSTATESRPAAGLSTTHSGPVGSMSLPPGPDIRPVAKASSVRVPSWTQPTPMQRPMEVMPAAQMAANAMAATSGWRPNWLNPKAYQALPREQFRG